MIEKVRSKGMLIVVSVVSFFVLIVSLSSLYTERVVSCGLAQTCTIPLPFLIPIIASVSLIVGSIMGYFMVEKISKKDEQNKINLDLIKNLLSKEEYKILVIVFNKKKVSQSEIVKKTGLPRLKVFRIVERFVEKGVFKKSGENKKLKMISLNNNFL